MTGIEEFRLSRRPAVGGRTPEFVAMTRACGALAVATDSLVATTTAYLAGRPSAAEADDVFAVLDAADAAVCLARASAENYIAGRRARELAALGQVARSLQDRPWNRPLLGTDGPLMGTTEPPFDPAVDNVPDPPLDDD